MEAKNRSLRLGSNNSNQALLGATGLLILFNYFLIVMVISATSFLIPKAMLAQAPPPCRPNSFGYYYQVPIENEFPKLNTSMTYEVMKGYIFADSIYRHSSLTELINWQENAKYDSSLKTLMKYYYSMVDWNPLHFAAQEHYPVMTSNYLESKKLSYSFIDAVLATSPTPQLDYFLLNSKYIAHIKVNSTQKGSTESIKDVPVEVVNVSAQILDPIKGKVLPNCVADMQKIKTDEDKQRSHLHSADTPCIQFTYSPSWGIYDENGGDFFKPGGEYIVFLDLVKICQTDLATYLRLRPVSDAQNKMPVFEVTTNGTVLNPDNIFGYGLTPTIADFKINLLSRINEIKN